MKITYENVCCIEHAVLDLQPGKLVAIVGESNQGKSALYYTLASGLLNSTDFKRFINNEALKKNAKAVAKISIEDDNNNFWQVEAGKGHLYYRHNKTKYEKVGRKNIFDITETQIPGLLYDVENMSPIMNIVDEDTGMFPIDRSDAQIFKTYERLLSLSCTEDILRTIKIDQEDVDFKISDFTNTIQMSLVKLKDIDNFYESIKDLELTTKITKLTELINSTNQLLTIYSQISSSAQYSEYVLNLPKFEKSDFDVKSFEFLVSSLVKAGNLQKYVKLAGIQCYDNAFDIKAVEELFKEFQKAAELTKEIETLSALQVSDKSELDNVTNILNEIKVCPYCGKPMED